jgi:hypothetical protein
MLPAQGCAIELPGFCAIPVRNEKRRLDTPPDSKAVQDKAEPSIQVGEDFNGYEK